MGVSLNGGTPQTPQNDQFLVGKPMVVGYPHFRKHLYIGDELLPSYMGIITNHDMRIPSFNNQVDSWKHIRFFVGGSTTLTAKGQPSWISRLSPLSTYVAW